MGPIEQSVLENLKNISISVDLLQGQLTNLKGQVDLGAESIDDVYNEGFEAGVASVPATKPSDENEKIYSQAEVDSMIGDAQSKIKELETANADYKQKADSMSADLEVLKSDMEGRVKAQVSAIKESFLAKYKEQQAFESASEEDFKKSFEEAEEENKPQA